MGLPARFAGQWLYLRNLRGLQPDADVFPDFDHNLREALQRETELLFESIVLEDKSVTTLLTADYTFVNERLARHYDIPNVYGTQFRRVPTDVLRRGLLGHGSVLALTSQNNRTSPVLRGKYVLTNLLGTPPPSPPAWCRRSTKTPAKPSRCGIAWTSTGRARRAQVATNSWIPSVWHSRTSMGSAAGASSITG